MYRKLKNFVFNIIQPAGEGNIASKVFDIVILTLIVISVVSVFILTFNLPDDCVKLLQRIEILLAFRVAHGVFRPQPELPQDCPLCFLPLLVAHAQEITVNLRLRLDAPPDNRRCKGLRTASCKPAARV